MKLSKNTNNLGQTLLIVLLVMAVTLVVVLSVISRTVTDVGVSSREEEATRAFSAAEAGVEEALLIGSIGEYGDDLTNNSSFNVTVSSVGEGDSEYNFPFKLENSETATLWFVSHDGDTLVCSGDAISPCFTGDRVEFLWGFDGTSPLASDTPALEISLYYSSQFKSTDLADGDFSEVDVKRLAYDPNTNRSNGFDNNVGIDSETFLIDGTEYEFSTGEITFTDATKFGIASNCQTSEGCMLVMKIRMLYNDPDLEQPLGVRVFGDTLPAQANLVESLGTAGASSRKIEVYQSFPELPQIFESALFNPNNIVKN